MSALLVLFPIDFEPCRPEKLLSLHRFFAIKQMNIWKGLSQAKKQAEDFV